MYNHMRQRIMYKGQLDLGDYIRAGTDSGLNYKVIRIKGNRARVQSRLHSNIYNLGYTEERGWMFL